MIGAKDRSSKIRKCWVSSGGRDQGATFTPVTARVDCESVASFSHLVHEHSDGGMYNGSIDKSAFVYIVSCCL